MTYYFKKLLEKLNSFPVEIFHWLFYVKFLASLIKIFFLRIIIFWINYELKKIKSLILIRLWTCIGAKSEPPMSGGGTGPCISWDGGGIHPTIGGGGGGGGIELPINWGAGGAGGTDDPLSWCCDKMPPPIGGAGGIDDMHGGGVAGWAGTISNEKNCGGGGGGDATDINGDAGWILEMCKLSFRENNDGGGGGGGIGATGIEQLFKSIKIFKKIWKLLVIVFFNKKFLLLLSKSGCICGGGCACLRFRLFRQLFENKF